MTIPTDEELQKHLEKLHEESHFKVPEELHGLDWFSFFDDEIINTDNIQ